jgi:hypothetical protein
MIIDGVHFSDNEILLTTPELVSILQGRPMQHMTTEGQTVTLRLFTADEFAAEVARLREGTGLPEMSRADAERLTRPLPD